MERVIAIIDGEHYPPVVRFALETLARESHVVAAVFVGGTEKVDLARGMESYGVPVVAGDGAIPSLLAAMEAYEPHAVIDLSDEPILSASRRMELASVALSRGVAYRGADFVFTPPQVRYVPHTPSVAVVGTGKRVGKTAVCAALARHTRESGVDPVVVAMGRGGPPEPELIRGDQVPLTTADLLEVARAGRHASSDNYEDAIMSRVATVGCRRCGGGLAGQTFFDNVPEGAKLADSLSRKVMLLEGSGAAIPPVHADACLLVAGAVQGVEAVRDHLGPYRVSRADLVLVAGADAPGVTSSDVDAIRRVVSRVRGDVPVREITFHPVPLEPVAGRRVMFVTTAPPAIASRLAISLEQRQECEVVAVSSALSDRAALRAALREHAGTFDVLLTELKAAAIDVVAMAGEEAGIPTVLCDNVPEALDGEPLGPVFDELVGTALARGARRLEEGEGDEPAS